MADPFPYFIGLALSQFPNEYSIQSMNSLQTFSFQTNVTKISKFVKKNQKM